MTECPELVLKFVSVIALLLAALCWLIGIDIKRQRTIDDYRIRLWTARKGLNHTQTYLEEDPYIAKCLRDSEDPSPFTARNIHRAKERR